MSGQFSYYSNAFRSAATNVNLAAMDVIYEEPSDRPRRSKRLKTKSPGAANVREKTKRKRSRSKSEPRSGHSKSGRSKSRGSTKSKTRKIA